MGACLCNLGYVIGQKERMDGLICLKNFLEHSQEADVLNIEGI